MTPPVAVNLLAHCLAVSRSAATGAIVLGVLFVLCWLGRAAGLLGASHMIVALFTSAPMTSAAARAYNAVPALKR